MSLVYIQAIFLSNRKWNPSSHETPELGVLVKVVVVLQLALCGAGTQGGQLQIEGWWNLCPGSQAFVEDRG